MEKSRKAIMHSIVLCVSLGFASATGTAGTSAPAGAAASPFIADLICGKAPKCYTGAFTVVRQ